MVFTSKIYKFESIPFVSPQMSDWCKVAKRFKYKPTISIGYFDLFISLHYMIDQIPGEMKFTHIKSYQVQTGNILLMWEKLNIICLFIYLLHIDFANKLTAGNKCFNNTRL